MVLYFPKSNANIFITGYSLLSQILSQPAKAKLVPNRWTLSNFQIDFGRPGFIVSGAQAPGSDHKNARARETGDSVKFTGFRPLSRAPNSFYWYLNLGLAPQALCLRLLSQAKGEKNET